VIAGLEMETAFDPETMVILAREDFVVRSLHTGTGQETWTATYG